MKSERRHDLETNQLAVQVQDFIDRVKPYASQIALVVVGLLALAYLGSVWQNASSKTEQNAWDEYTLASYSTDPELNSMKILAENEKYAGTPVPEWAYMAWADRQLLLASQTYLTNREATEKRLEAALDVYRTLADDASVAQLQDRARYGLAQVLEMQGKPEDAREAYLRVKGDLAALAKSRAEQLESKEVQEAVKWLATAELPKRETPSTSGLGTGVKPSFDADSPAPKPTANPLNDIRSLEEILIGSPETSADTNRYGEEDSAESTDAEAEQPEDDADSQPAAETDEPASEQ